jgi:hypothetical protein
MANFLKTDMTEAINNAQHQTLTSTVIDNTPTARKFLQNNPP